MRRPTLIKGLKNSQKLRVILDGVGFYMTVAETEKRFAMASHYGIVYSVLQELAASDECQGIAKTVYAYDYKMKKVPVQVQVDLM